MCTTCGCSSTEEAYQVLVPDGATQLMEGAHSHPSHALQSGREQTLSLEQDILQKNNLSAARNRGFLEARRVTAINLVSSPGSGKTAILERTIRQLHGEVSLAVIEGDQQTMRDTDRIQQAGAPAVQINTGTGCHLDADMVMKGMRALNPSEDSLLFIENVGNLVCPALFDLGEQARVVIMSVTEGEDKPLKYPHMFAGSQLCLINKIDLLPYLDFDLEEARAYLRQVNPRIQVMEVSATKGLGMEQWYHWLQHALQKPHHH